MDKQLQAVATLQYAVRSAVIKAVTDPANQLNYNPMPDPSLPEHNHGYSKKEHIELCPHCNGRGSHPRVFTNTPGAPTVNEKCGYCRGVGRVLVINIVYSLPYRPPIL
jgi:DnaJ-class molecular chaperone